jgi:hypothetical protein
VNRTNTPGTDAAELVARSELATNQYDPYWPMTRYAKTIRLEIVGDGVHDIQDGMQDGSDAVALALFRIHEWLAACAASITKTLIATSHDTVIKHLGGKAPPWPDNTLRRRALAIRWRRPRGPPHPADRHHPQLPGALNSMRALLRHPRTAVAYLNTVLQQLRTL